MFQLVEMQKNHPEYLFIMGLFGCLTSIISIVVQPVKGKSGNNLALPPRHDQLPHGYNFDI